MHADFKGELCSLNRELLFQFLDVLGALVERPHASARGVENIGQLLRNMHYLLNLLRAHQARPLMLLSARFSAPVVLNPRTIRHNGNNFTSVGLCK